MNTATNATLTRDGGLRSYMLGIYNYMFLGLLISGVSAYAANASGFSTYMVQHSVLFFMLMLVPFGLIFAMAGADEYNTSGMFGMYGVFTVIEGLTLAPVLQKYSGADLTLTFAATSAVFAGLSLFGYTTKRNLQMIGTFLIGALWGLIAVMVLAIFMHSKVMDTLVSIAGVLLFSGLIAWDTQTLKDNYDVRGNSQKAMIWGALDLYLDFLNMFLFLLRLLGVSSNND